MEVIKRAFFTEMEVEDRSHIAFIKRQVNADLADHGISLQQAAKVDLVIAELATNIIKHAGFGKLLYRISKKASEIVFEMYSLDNGPGSDNMQKKVQDGVSSSNTLGHGLGSIKRLSRDFHIYSAKNWGTVVYCKVVVSGPEVIDSRKPTVDMGAVQVCYPGEKICGDAYAVRKVEKGYLIFVGDGLGHGFNAHHAVKLALEIFDSTRSVDPVVILTDMNRHVKDSRGLVASVIYLNMTDAKMSVCGVGNISVRVVNGLAYKSFISYNGIIGANFPRTIVNSTYDLCKYDILVVNSDGIQSKWNLNAMPSILKYDANIIASAIYKSYARNNDDMTVFTAKISI
ncbi:ATP-binding protein [Flavobacterium selenitireducens]|uniref:ATP-binding protein n=1 Tax=Flavobacterium selenitireducens TaxID=2722704 RepID=UPI00168A8023|nr:ATP-binding protein [Flavobacterium selenitireducens]MBD3581876.1 SpoIIE family protein phosphatase [Flavobacterium selenitireducens]